MATSPVSAVSCHTVMQLTVHLIICTVEGCDCALICRKSLPPLRHIGAVGVCAQRQPHLGKLLRMHQLLDFQQQNQSGSEYTCVLLCLVCSCCVTALPVGCLSPNVSVPLVFGPGFRACSRGSMSFTRLATPSPWRRCWWPSLSSATSSEFGQQRDSIQQQKKLLKTEMSEK